MSASAGREPEVQEERPLVLVVEDDVLVRLAISDELRDRGLAVVEASSADEALSVLQSSVPVHLLFTDIEMPGKIDGATLVELIRSTFPDMKIAFASGRRPAGDLISKAHAFFEKPYHMATVSGRLMELITTPDGKL
jgi:CheY-like chemotaxis protein